MAHEMGSLDVNQPPLPDLHQAVSELRTMIAQQEGWPSEVARRAQALMDRVETEAMRSGRDVFRLAGGQAVSAPAELAPLFDAAQQTVQRHFQTFRADPSHGTVDIGGERYLLVRASALSVEFFATIRKMYSERGDEEAFAIGHRFLFDIGHAIGMSDAHAFHAKMGLVDPVQRLSAGPVHFAYTGWAYVKIRPESKPTPTEDYFLKYDHPFSFEADSWLRAGQRSHEPVCVMNAGYSSGWCEASFGMPLTAVEVSCRARGDATCTFIMAPPHRIHGYVDRPHPGDSGQPPRSPSRVASYFEGKRLEEELRSKEQRYRELFQHMSDGVVVFEAMDDGADFLVRDANEACLRIERTSGENIIGRRVTDAFPGVEQFGLLRVMRRVWCTGIPERMPAAYYEDSRISGWRENFVYRLPTGEVVAVYRDVSDVKVAAEALRSALDATERIIDAAPFAMVLVGTDGAIRRANSAAGTVFGVESPALIGARWSSFVPATSGAGGHSGSGQAGAMAREVAAVKSSGESTTLLLAEIPAVIGREAMLIEAFLDLTDRLALEVQLRHAQKLDAVGKLAAGLAHEFNTPAQYVGDNIEFLAGAFSDLWDLLDRYRGAVDEVASAQHHARLLEELREAEARADTEYLERSTPEALAQAAEGIGRISKIVAAMKEFAQPEERGRRPLDLNAALQTTLTITHHELDRVADVKVELGDLPPVLGRMDELCQVFANLLLNAAQAVSAKHQPDVQRGTICVRTSSHGPAVQVDISDDGPGIPDDIKHRIFEPFFTTKEVGAGAGQGLAVAYSIVVDKHGGALTFESKVGEGTTFTVLLPLSPSRGTNGSMWPT